MVLDFLRGGSSLCLNFDANKLVLVLKDNGVKKKKKSSTFHKNRGNTYFLSLRDLIPEQVRGGHWQLPGPGGRRDAAGRVFEN